MPFSRCDTPALEMRVVKIGAAAGNVSGLVEVRNTSSHSCDLYGYAGVQLLDSSGKALPTRVEWSTTSFFQVGPTPPSIVGLPAGTPPIDPSRPVPGHAYIPLSWNDVAEPCSTASLLRVTPPDAYRSIVISAAVPALNPPEIFVCSGGTLIVNPTRPASY